MTDASRYLTALAERIAQAYIAQAAPRAMLLTGSAAEGVSDAFSDLDLIAYYEQAPAPEHLATARAVLRVTDFRLLAGQEMEEVIEAYALSGVECQVAHVTVAAWERDMASVLEAYEPGTVVEKAISGLQYGVALHGSDLIARWQARAATYPEELAHATVERHLRFFPLWLLGEQWQTRDATMFYYQSLVDVSFNLLSMLAGLNRLYFSSFQFKRLHRFAAKLRLAPENLAQRLEQAFALDPVAGSMAMERLMEETVALVEAHMPAADTAAARRQLGRRQRPWAPAEELAHADP